MRLVAASVLIALTGCGSSRAAPPSTPEPPAAAAAPEVDVVGVYRAWVEAANAGSWPEVIAAFSEDATLIPASSGMELAGAANIGEFFKSFSVGFPDLRTTPIMILTRPGHVTAISIATGTNSAAVGPFEATGHAMSFIGLTEIAFDASGKMTRVIAYADNLNFMGQMGQWKGSSREPVSPPSDPLIIVRQGSEAGEPARLARVASLVEAFNRHDAPALLQLYLPDAVLDDQHLPGPIITAHQIGTHYSDLFPAFPDIAMADVQSWAAGDYVVLTYTLRGTHAGAYARLPGTPSYRQLELQGAALLRLRGEQIAEHLVFVDGMAMGFQLGLLAMPGAEPPPAP
ncbi:MAG TPA: nuclear transport factor 2 family protein [Kofleriaceae bacterium]|nr:nuclear transport factor 2 family protein [Kofleriaceae bacterium]